MHNSTSKCLLRPRTRINAKPVAPPRAPFAPLGAWKSNNRGGREIRLIPDERTNEANVVYAMEGEKGQTAKESKRGEIKRRSKRVKVDNDVDVVRAWSK